MIQIVSFRMLRGPNVWTNVPVLEAQVNLGELADELSNRQASVITRFASWLNGPLPRPHRPPGLAAYQERLEQGVCWTRTLAELAFQLEVIAGADVGFWGAAAEGHRGSRRLAVEVEERALAEACLAAAVEACNAAHQSAPLDFAALAQKLRHLAEEICLGPSTRAVVRAASARGIPVRRLNTRSLLQLGHGSSQRRFVAGESDATGAIAEAISQDKQLTKALAQAAGVPVPEGRIVTDPEDAWRLANQIGLPVVLKPRNGNHGRGVFTDITTKEQIQAIFPAVLQEGDSVIVERFAPGAEHRVLVVGDRGIAAMRGEPELAIADGLRSVAQLMDELNQNPRRGEDDECPLAKLEFDATTLALLQHHGYSPESIPTAGARVLFQRNGNLSIDVTDEVHPEVARCTVRAARAVGLDIAGIDLVTPDISQPLEPQRGAIVEVNAGPGMLMHLWPAVGQPRPVGEAVVHLLFPPHHTGRIPLVGLLSPFTDADTFQQMESLLRVAYGEVGTVRCRDDRGLSPAGPDLARGTPADPDVGGHPAAGCEATARGDWLEWNDRARQMLVNPFLAAAIFEISPAAVWLDGLPFDRCRAVVLDLRQWLSAPPIDQDAFKTTARVLLRTLEPTGSVVVAAEDLLGLEAARGRDLIMTTTSGDAPHLVAHLGDGGRAVFVRDNALVLGHGDGQLGQIPLGILAHLGAARADAFLRVALTAAAVAWSLNIPWETIRDVIGSTLPARTDE